MSNELPRRIKNLKTSKFYCILEEKESFIKNEHGKYLNDYLLYEFKDEKEFNKFLETNQTKKKIKSYMGLSSDFNFKNYVKIDQQKNMEEVVENQKEKPKRRETKKVQSSTTKKEDKSEKEYCVVVDCKADDIVLLNVKRDFELYEFKDKKTLEDFIKTGKTKVKKEKQSGLVSNFSNYIVLRRNEEGKVEKIKKENLVNVKNLEFYSIVHIYPSMSRYLISSDEIVISDSLFNYKEYKNMEWFSKSSEQDFLDFEKKVEKCHVVKLSNQMITLDLMKNLSSAKEEHLFLNVFDEPRILDKDDKEYFAYNESLYKNNFETIKESLEQKEKTHPELAIEQLKDVLSFIGVLDENGSIKASYLKAFANNQNKKLVKTKEAKKN